MSSTNITLSSTLTSIQQYVTRYLYSVYLIFGVSGCLLNILLLSRQQFRTISCCTYFIAASAVMIVNMSMTMGSTMYTINHGDPTLTSMAFCKMRIYVIQTSAYIYRSCLCAACFDRFALSSTNVRLRNFSKVHMARRVIAVIVPVWLVLPCHSLIVFSLRNGACGILYSFPAAVYHSVFTVIFAGIIPTSVMATCTMLIYRNLAHKRQRRQQHVNGPSAERDGAQNLLRKRDQQVLAMLLTQVIVYVILIIPIVSYYFFSTASLFVTNKSSDRVAIERFALFAAEVVLELFPTSSFYLYTMASRTFREEFIKVLYLTVTCKWLGPNRHVAPTTNNMAHKKTPGIKL